MAMSSIAGTALVRALAKPAQEIYRWGKDRAQSELDFLRNEQSLKHVARCLRRIDKVKTFWSDKEVSLLSFYYPSRLMLDNRNPTIVHSLEELPPSQCYVIEGTVGQGKSIFLRYLASKELKRSGDDLRIPIFAELRFLRAEEEFEKFIFDAFEASGLKITPQLFSIYAGSGRIVLFLDAFDEIDPSLVQKTIRDLDRLAGLYPQLQIIVSARPESGIQRTSGFRTLKLVALQRRDHKPFLEKLTKSKAQADNILNAINGSSSNIDGLLTTPLLLTLLVMLYASHQHIPDTVSEFYSELFDVLFYKHDRTKSGFRRHRHVDVSDSKIKKMFEGVCFFSVLKGYRSFGGNQFTECTEQAGRSSLVDVNVQGFREELVKTACLLKEEGPELSFIHKSVQEFYSAAFVARSNDEFARQFYTTVMSGKNQRSWNQQLVFLREIDEWRYSKYYWIPGVERLAAAIDIPIAELFSEQYSLTRDQVVKLMEGVEIGFYVDPVDSDGDDVSPSTVHEMDSGDVFVGKIDWEEVGSYSEGPIFSTSGPLQGVYYALCAPVSRRWTNDDNGAKLEELAFAIEQAAENHKLTHKNTSLIVMGLGVELTTYDDGSFTAEFALDELLDYADEIDKVVMVVNQELDELKTKRERLLDVIAAEEQKASMLELMVKAKQT